MLADAATTHEEPREPIRDACTRFPDGYTRNPGERRESPKGFVRALAGSDPYLVSSYLVGHAFPGLF